MCMFSLCLGCFCGIQFACVRFQPWVVQRKALFSLFSASHLHLLCPVASLGCSELCAVALLFPSCRAEQHLPAEA